MAVCTAPAAPPGTARASRTAVVTVPQWPLLAALERHLHPGPGSAPSEVGERGADPADGGPAGSRPTAPASAAESARPAPAEPAPPVILLAHHRVVDADARARELGVLPGMRRRSARAACPHALALETDPEAESSLFELVAAAVDTVAAGVDVLRPGVLLMSAAGPARHHGGEEALAERLIDAVAEQTGWDATVGIADGPFAAMLAAGPGRIIRPGRSADYLAPHPIAALMSAPVGAHWGRSQPPRSGASRTARRADLPATIDLLQRLGIATLGDLVALPAASVADRFGPDAALLHLLARGEEPAPPAMHRPAQPIEVQQTLEHPLTRTDQAAFAARPLAERLDQQLREHGLICTRLRILARTESGEEMERTWRHDGALTAEDVIDRIRWQCDGWITRARLGGPATGAITSLALLPVQLMPALEQARALWGSAGEADQRAQRALARAQALAGERAVLVPAPTGGRLLAEQVRAVPWRSEKPAARTGPWPGSLPRPVPATVFRRPPAIDLLDAGGAPVVITARGLVSAPPARLLVHPPGAPALTRCGLRPGIGAAVVGYGPPVLLDERWWASDGQRAARLQLVVRLDGGEDLALLALSHQGAWTLEGLYD